MYIEILAFILILNEKSLIDILYAIYPKVRYNISWKRKRQPKFNHCILKCNQSFTNGDTNDPNLQVCWQSQVVYLWLIDIFFYLLCKLMNTRPLISSYVTISMRLSCGWFNLFLYAIFNFVNSICVLKINSALYEWSAKIYQIYWDGELLSVLFDFLTN